MDTNRILMINPANRKIEVPEKERLIGVYQDHDTERKYFKCPRIVGDNVDLSQHRIYVNYVPSKINGIFNEDEEVGSYLCEDVATDGDYVTFSWKISENVTRAAGYIAFAVYAKKADDDGKLKTKWHTTPAIGNVLDTLPDGDQIVNRYPDVIEQIMERLDKIGEIDPEQIAAAVEEYMEANPVPVGATEEQVEQIQKNADDITDLQRDKVDKSEIGYGGIKSVAYIPLFGGEFSVTTETEEGYIKPHALASVTGRISKHYVYRVTVNGTKYELPCDLYCFAVPDGGFKCYEYLGNLSLYVEDVSGVTHDIRNVPFLIISDLDNAQSIDVFTDESITASIIVEQIQKNETEIPKSLFFGDDYYPFEFKKNGGTYNGTSIGINSLYNSRGTVAIGYANVVNNEFAQAFGIGTIVNGKFAQAFGYKTIASGVASHAEGNQTEASGDYSNAEGYKSIANGLYSHAEGYDTEARGKGSHAEGLFTEASGDYSHAEGYKPIASGVASHAEGNQTEASGGGSHAEGQKCIATGALSHSGGNRSESQGYASFAHGNYVKTIQDSQFAVGYGNDPQEDSIFEVGNGLDENGLPKTNDPTKTAPVTRQNAFRVTQSGIAIAQKGLGIGKTNIDEEQLKKLLDEESNVSAHNISDTAHNDIRLLVQGLAARINALADSDDTTLDQMSEVVAYIKSNKALIDAITNSKVSVSDIIDNLATNVSDKPLSAAQGVVLKRLIDAITTVELDETLTDNTKAAPAGIVGELKSDKLDKPETPPTAAGEVLRVLSVNKDGTFTCEWADAPSGAAITEQDVANWGFTKNTGTYSKPDGGIPKSDLADDVIPNSLKNPCALNFVGAVSGSYDGSEPFTVNIPVAGSGDGGSGYKLLHTFASDESADLLLIPVPKDVLASMAEKQELFVTVLFANLGSSSGTVNISAYSVRNESNKWINGVWYNNSNPMYSNNGYHFIGIHFVPVVKIGGTEPFAYVDYWVVSEKNNDNRNGVFQKNNISKLCLNVDWISGNTDSYIRIESEFTLPSGLTVEIFGR